MRMQNWDAMQPTANYEQHNNWYNSMFAANIKTEPGTTSPGASHHQHHHNHHSHHHASPMQSPTPPPTVTAASSSHLENYLKQQQQHLAAMDTMSAMTPSPSNNDSMQHFFESNMQQHLLQQQQYQQQFQQAQQAAAQNQVTSAHMPLGFNPLTPPGLPNAVLPSISHFYQHANLRPGEQTPSPQPPHSQSHLAVTPIDGNDKLQSALTPRNTPPMDVTPPKSPKAAHIAAASSAASEQLEKDQDLVSNSSEDMKYMAESEDDESIRMPIYNSHGKMKNYKCKSCGLVAITKVSFWEHVRSHMKPEKILQCPKCPFVTELKHHLEYHIRKHKNLKPFQCDKCSYSCVNKSMLNSHRKSHSSVYQYRCSDCDYATKYCHSFKLHLRKYDHKPGMVLDEEGIPNPSVVIDVYGTRRGPKTKSVSGSSKRSSASERSCNSNSGQAASELKVPTSQLSAALQGFPIAQQHTLPASPAKSTSSGTSELPTLSALTMTLQQQQQQQQQQHQQQQQQHQQQIQHQQHQQKQSAASQPNGMPTTPVPTPQQHAMSNLLPPLASILQQNRSIAFFPYWNLNLQMLAAQQQAVLAQLSPRMRESALQQLEKNGMESAHEDDDDEDEDFDRKSVDSAMDLSQGTPTKEEQQAEELAINLKLQEEVSETPLICSTSSSRRKGRVLKLDTLLHIKAAALSPEKLKAAPATPHVSQSKQPMPNASSPIAANVIVKLEDNSSADESMETAPAAPGMVAAVTASPPAATSANTSSSSTASSSGNSSNSSNASSSNPVGAMYECKYCDIYFKDAVLYTIHMGYHSCDDVFKCNMCGEKCDGPVGLFVHMARNAHS